MRQTVPHQPRAFQRTGVGCTRAFASLKATSPRHLRLRYILANAGKACMTNTVTVHSAPLKVSIVTPSFNQAPFITRTIESVLSQDWKSLDYIVCDGDSTDGTQAILAKYGDRIAWISEKDDGQADAVNKGIRATDGDIIGWLNSDDIYYPGTVRTVVEYFSRHPEFDVVYGMADHIDVDDRPYEPYPTEPWNFVRLQEICFLCQPAVFLRRSVIERHGLLDTSLRFCMDYEYWLRLGAAGIHFGYLERRLAGSRMYPENKTLGARLQMHAENNNMIWKRFGQVPHRWIFAYAHAWVEEHVTQSKYPMRFIFRMGTPLLLALLSLFAALYWNRRVSPEMFKVGYGLLTQRRGKFIRGALGR
jgi:glycosyltransferase involved in cell wall biosynthesis